MANPQQSNNLRIATDKENDPNLTLIKGSEILRSKPSSLADEECNILEKTFSIAINQGNIPLADECLNHLTRLFPSSQRVDVLHGIRIEATESLDVALEYYNQLLEEDPTHVGAWKRRIALFRRLGKLEKAAEDLSLLVDTIYTDVEAWLELAELYAAINQYNLALQSLSHVLSLAPQNAFYVLLFAEMAYTANDVSLALRMFLLATELWDTNEALGSAKSPRAWWGVYLCCTRLMGGATYSQSQTSPPSHTKKLMAIARNQLSAAYHSSPTHSIVSLVEQVLSRDL